MCTLHFHYIPCSISNTITASRKQENAISSTKCFLTPTPNKFCGNRTHIRQKLLSSSLHWAQSLKHSRCLDHLSNSCIYSYLFYSQSSRIKHGIFLKCKILCLYVIKIGVGVKGWRLHSPRMRRKKLQNSKKKKIYSFYTL